jgi:hypothetical protein
VKSTIDDMRSETPLLLAPAWFWQGILFLAGFGITSFGQAPITNGLVARWPGDGNAKDSAGHFDGQVSGGLRYGPGLTGQAFEFNGGSSQVDFGPTAGNFGTRDFTIAYWMKTSSTIPTEAFLGKRAVCNLGIWWNIRVGTQSPPVTGALNMEVDDGTPAGYMTFATTNAFNDGRWHHVAWERQSTSSGTTTYLVFVDGMLNNTHTHPDAADLQNTTPLVLGQSVCQGSDGTRPYSGAAEELQLFSHALSAEEIFTIYKAGNSGK